MTSAQFEDKIPICQDIVDEFLLLCDKVMKFLIQNDCEGPYLQVCVMDVRHVEIEPVTLAMKELVAAESVENIFTVLTERKIISVLHIESLQRIIQTLCFESKDLKKTLDDYEIMLNEYMRRCVYETSFYEEDGTITEAYTNDTVKLSIVTGNTWDKDTPLENVLIFDKMITAVFSCQQFVIHLTRIDPQTLRLNFAISCHDAFSFFPLTEEEWKYATTQGIMEIDCLEYHYSGTFVMHSFHQANI